MEDYKKVKAKIPVKSADGSFSVLEGEESIFEEKNEPIIAPLPVREKPAAPQPIYPAQPVSAPSSPYRPTLRPDQQVAEKAPVNFYYSQADEQEVRAEKEKLEQFGSTGLETDGERVTNEIIARHHLTFADEIYRKRLIAIVNSRLKDIRDFVETQEMLGRPLKVGGMGYDPALVEQILKIIEEEATKMHGHPLPKVHPAKVQPPAPINRPVPQAVRPPKPVVPVVEKPQPQIAQAPKPLPPRTAVVDRPAVLSKKAPVPPSAIPSIIRPSFDAEKPRVEDIKRPNRVMSPVDEIRELSLVDFERLGENAPARLNKLAEKIDLLQEESYAKKAEGIAAWKQSPVYKLYVSIGQQSMASRQPIEQTIEARQRQGLPVISFQEFQLIADFNKSLRF